MQLSDEVLKSILKIISDPNVQTMLKEEGKEINYDALISFIKRE